MSNKEVTDQDCDTGSESLDYGLDDMSDCGSVKMESDDKRRQRQDFLGLNKERKNSKLPNKSQVADEYSREEFKRERFHFVSLDAYSRHKILVNNYLKYYGGSMDHFKRDSSKDKTDLDVLREHHRFLWEEDEEANTWGKKLAKKYYDKLFKEYCIADLSMYKKNKIALRWRIEREVVSGKGQFACGEKHCEERDLLRSWEVNFGYVENGEKKNALVKLRLCSDCSYKLNYHHKRKDVTKESKKKRKATLSADEQEMLSKKPKISDESQESGKEMEAPKITKTSSVEDVWTQERVIEVEKSKEEEFDEYFEDMFL